MKPSTLGIIPMIFLLWLVWGPIIINSQPGSTFFLFGIDWKADNLDNTMFWTGILLIFAGAFAEAYSDKEKERKRAKEEQERDLR